MVAPQEFPEHAHATQLIYNTVAGRTLVADILAKNQMHGTVTDSLSSVFSDIEGKE